MAPTCSWSTRTLARLTRCTTALMAFGHRSWHDSGRLPQIFPMSTSRPVPIPAWAEALSTVLDDAFRIPGTRVRIGLDAILGFLAPGAGDAATGIAAATLVWLGFKLRVPKVILLRMLLNIGVDALVGAVPVLGDLFDVFYRASQKNLALLRRYGGEAPAEPDAGDHAIVALALLVALSLLLLPLVTGLVLVYLVARLSSG
jgi:Domain of unknown function (DUF4112)